MMHVWCRAVGAATVGAVVGFLVIGPLTAVVAGGAALYGNGNSYTFKNSNKYKGVCS
jgi:hypothetical protein